MDKEYIKEIIYSSGDVFLPEKARNILEKELIGKYENTFYIAGWSIVHFISGLIFGYIYLSMKGSNRSYIFNMFIFHSTWEIWQMLIGMSKPYKLTGRSNLVDTLVDTLIFLTGAYIIRWLKSGSK